MGHSLQETGDVIPAAGRPDEGVGLHGDVVSHQLGGLLAAWPTGVPHTIVVHPKPKAHDKTVTTLNNPCSSNGKSGKMDTVDN